MTKENSSRLSQIKEKTRPGDAEPREKYQEEQTIPGMELDTKYQTNKLVMPENSEKIQKELEKTKKELDKLKVFIVKKYPFTQAIGILPPQSIKIFTEEEIGENVPEQDTQKLQKKIHFSWPQQRR